MKTLSSFVVLTVLATATLSQLCAQPVPPPAAPRPRVSPHDTISTYVGGDRRTGSLVTITYGRPYSARGGKGETRKIWGSLVPWGKADRLGADEATLIVTQVPIDFGGKVVPAGAYTLYIIPSEDGVSKLAFSSNIGKWGIPVDETHDVARFDLKKDTLSSSVDQLTIAIEGSDTGGVLKIAWETTQFSLPFTVKKS
jgi:hypothetical protein